MFNEEDNVYCQSTHTITFGKNLAAAVVLMMTKSSLLKKKIHYYVAKKTSFAIVLVIKSRLIANGM